MLAALPPLLVLVGARPDADAGPTNCLQTYDPGEEKEHILKPTWNQGLEVSQPYLQPRLKVEQVTWLVVVSLLLEPGGGCQISTPGLLQYIWWGANKFIRNILKTSR